MIEVISAPKEKRTLGFSAVETTDPLTNYHLSLFLFPPLSFVFHVPNMLFEKFDIQMTLVVELKQDLGC